MTRSRAVLSVSTLLAAMVLAVASCQEAQPVPTPPVPPGPVVPHEVDHAKELMITDLSVVNDPRTQGPSGTWSFGHLMTQIAGGTDPSRFVVNWLKTWDSEQRVNGFAVAARPNIQDLIIKPWKERDGQKDVDIDQWQVKFENAPFRLLAIVNRLDLNRGTPAKVDSAGEGRFVFGVLGPAGEPLLFTVIFEYELLATDRTRLREWATAWHALGTMPFGPQYNEALQRITDTFAAAKSAPSKPNGSALNQIRTNEIALSFPGGWELREFNIREDGFLHQVAVKQTPANSFQNKDVLANFINLHEQELLDNSIVIPERLESGDSFRAGASLVAPPVRGGFFWDAPGIQNNEARHKLAFLSCNGCHHKETGTTNFLHVSNRTADQEAQLSGFLKGIDVPDPVQPQVIRNFSDLKDRAEILKLLAEERADRVVPLKRNRAARVH